MHLKLKISALILLVIFLFIIVGCSKNEEEKYVAKVGSAYLTEGMIDKAVGTESKSNKFREEFIRNWIETELIYLDATEQGIENTANYGVLVEQAKIDIANSIAINNVFKKNPIAVTDNELEEYYINNFREFQMVSPKVVYNEAVFKNKKEARYFRRVLLKEGWKKALTKSRKKGYEVNSIENKSEFIYNIFNKQFRNFFLLEKIKNVSSIIEISPNLFSVLNLIKRNDKNNLPEFEDVKKEIRQKYITIKRKAIYNNYLKKLFSEYRSEIER